MDDGSQTTHPLPDHPLLAEAAAAIRDTGQWGWMVDSDWNLIFATDELRRTWGAGTLADTPIGVHYFSSESVLAFQRNTYGTNSWELLESSLRILGGLMLADASGDREKVRSRIAPELRHVIDDLEPDERTVTSFNLWGADLRRDVRIPSMAIRLTDQAGTIVGTLLLGKVDSGMDTLAALVSQSDPRHIERMQAVARAGRRPAAILFADLEGSSALSKKLPTASYFTLGRRLVRAADRCVIDAGGIVGRHVGDGVVAFFLAEQLGSESAAARASIVAARSLRATVIGIAEQSGLNDEDVTLRFGLHWGATLFVGNISTGGRHEVTALGDEVNEGARIEACAGGGRTLASKALIERLSPSDASSFEIDPDQVTYTMLADLTTATEKARRDAPAIAVCDIQ